MLLNSSKFSVVGTIVCALATSGALLACSGVDDYPSVGEGGTQQQGNGGSATASGGSANGGTTPTGNGGSGTGGSNTTGNGGANSGNGGSSTTGNGGSSSAKGGSSSTGNGGSSSAKGGSSSTGTGGSSSTGASFTQVQTIVKNQCGVCHFSGGESPNLSTSGSTLYGTLTNTAVRQCSSNKLVVANNANMSALVSLVSGKCSLKMPPTCTSSPCIAQTDIDTISSWINAGAKQQ